MTTDTKNYKRKCKYCTHSMAGGHICVLNLKTRYRAITDCEKWEDNGGEFKYAYQRDITCPYCGYYFDDSYRFLQNNGDSDVICCNNCERYFEAELEIIYEYTSSKIKLDIESNSGCPSCPGKLIRNSNDNGLICLNGCGFEILDVDNKGEKE